MLENIFKKNIFPENDFAENILRWKLFYVETNGALDKLSQTEFY